MRKGLLAMVLSTLVTMGILSSVVGATPEVVVDLLDLRTDVWQAQPGWLGNPTEAFSLAVVPVDKEVSQEGKAWRFEVDPGGRGMKWTARFGEYVSTAGTPYLSLTYRTKNIRSEGTGQAHEDFLLLVYDRYENEIIPVQFHALEVDGDWHQIVVRLPEMEMMMLVFQLQAVGDGAFIEVASMQLRSNQE